MDLVESEMLNLMIYSVLDGVAYFFRNLAWRVLLTNYGGRRVRGCRNPGVIVGVFLLTSGSNMEYKLSQIAI